MVSTAPERLNEASKHRDETMSIALSSLARIVYILINLSP